MVFHVKQPSKDFSNAFVQQEKVGKVTACLDMHAQPPVRRYRRRGRHDRDIYDGVPRVFTVLLVVLRRVRTCGDPQIECERTC